MRCFTISRDEQMVAFDMAVYRKVQLAAPLPQQWRGYAEALVPAFLLNGPAPTGVVSAHLPINALLHLAFSLVAEPRYLNPLPAALVGARIVRHRPAAVRRLPAGGSGLRFSFTRSPARMLAALQTAVNAGGQSLNECCLLDRIWPLLLNLDPLTLTWMNLNLLRFLAWQHLAFLPVGPDRRGAEHSDDRWQVGGQRSGCGAQRPGSDQLSPALSSRTMNREMVAELCRRGAVSTIGWHDMHRVGFGANAIGRGSRFDELVAVLRAGGCLVRS